MTIDTYILYRKKHYNPQFIIIIQVMHYNCAKNVFYFLIFMKYAYFLQSQTPAYTYMNIIFRLNIRKIIIFSLLPLRKNILRLAYCIYSPFNYVFLISLSIISHHCTSSIFKLELYIYYFFFILKQLTKKKIHFTCKYTLTTCVGFKKCFNIQLL